MIIDDDTTLENARRKKEELTLIKDLKYNIMVNYVS